MIKSLGAWFASMNNVKNPRIVTKANDNNCYNF